MSNAFEGRSLRARQEDVEVDPTPGQQINALWEEYFVEIFVITSGVLVFAIVGNLLMRSFVGRLLDQSLGRLMDGLCRVLQLGSDEFYVYGGTMYDFLVEMWGFVRHPPCTMAPFRWDRMEASESFVYFNLLYSVISVPVLVYDAGCSLDLWIARISKFNWFDTMKVHSWFMYRYRDVNSQIIELVEKAGTTFLMAHVAYYIARRSGPVPFRGTVLLVCSLVMCNFCFMLTCDTVLTVGRLFAGVLMVYASIRMIMENCLGIVSGAAQYIPIGGDLDFMVDRDAPRTDEEEPSARAVAPSTKPPRA